MSTSSSHRSTAARKGAATAGSKRIGPRNVRRIWGPPCPCSKHRPGAEPAAGGRFSAQLGSTGAAYRRRYWQDEALHAVESLRVFFEGRGQSLATAAVAWVLDQPGITAAIVGASRPEQLDATLAASGFALDDEARARLDQVWYDLPRRRPETGPVR